MYTTMAPLCVAVATSRLVEGNYQNSTSTRQHTQEGHTFIITISITDIYWNIHGLGAFVLGGHHNCLKDIIILRVPDSWESQLRNKNGQWSQFTFCITRMDCHVKSVIWYSAFVCRSKWPKVIKLHRILFFFPKRNDNKKNLTFFFPWSRDSQIN